MKTRIEFVWGTWDKATGCTPQCDGLPAAEAGTSPWRCPDCGRTWKLLSGKTFTSPHLPLDLRGDPA